MSISIPYRGRVISVDQAEEGFLWQYEDDAFRTAGTEPCSTRQAAILAAKTEIDAEEGGPLVPPQ
jgi:hypothetical protein